MEPPMRRAGLAVGLLCATVASADVDWPSDPRPGAGRTAGDGGSRGPAPDCAEGMGLPKALAEPGSVVLFGEIHGVRELPAFFAEVVCAAAAAGLPAEVGFEMPRGDQPTVDAFMASKGTAAHAEALIATPFWSREYQDGRSSRARLDLLERLRALRGSGLPIGVFLFDIAPDEPMSTREKRMAEAIAAHARSRPRALTLVLIGEVHAWKTKGAPWNPEFQPMGWHLVEAGLRVRSLGRVTPAGTAWICTSASASDCGPKSAAATGALPSGRAHGIELLSEPSLRGYDAMYATPTMTPSAPAKSK